MPSSSALGATGGAYTCNLDTFASHGPFACELSDLSGKHAVIIIDAEMDIASTTHTRTRSAPAHGEHGEHGHRPTAAANLESFGPMVLLARGVCQCFFPNDVL